MWNKVKNPNDDNRKKTLMLRLEMSIFFLNIYNTLTTTLLSSFFFLHQHNRIWVLHTSIFAQLLCGDEKVFQFLFSFFFLLLLLFLKIVGDNDPSNNPMWNGESNAKIVFWKAYFSIMINIWIYKCIHSILYKCEWIQINIFEWYYTYIDI